MVRYTQKSSFPKVNDFGKFSNTASTLKKVYILISGRFVFFYRFTIQSRRFTDVKTVV